MKSLRIHQDRIKVNIDTFISCAFVLYMCLDLVKAFMRKCLGFVGLEAASSAVCFLLIYTPVVLACLISGRYVIKDFLAIYAFLAVFFLVSYLLHPENEYWYTREVFGAWDYVFRPDNGIYIFLFIRLLKDPEKILKCLKISAVIMVAYYGYRLIPFLRTGRWTVVQADGSIKNVTYSLEYGYDVLLFALVFLYSALKEKKVRYWILTVASLTMIMIGGSRGPFLCVAVFLVLYFWVSLERSPKRVLYIFLSIAAGAVLFLTYRYILEGVSAVLGRLGISSRIIKTMIAENVSDDNGRLMFWKTTLEMIRENPLGYGAMGTRYVLNVYHTAGYPHNFFLEVLADFGVLPGGCLCLFLIVKTFSILKNPGDDKWKGLFLIFLGMFCQLMLSATFYHRQGFWGALAAGICFCRCQKKKDATKDIPSLEEAD